MDVISVSLCLPIVLCFFFCYPAAAQTNLSTDASALLAFQSRLLVGSSLLNWSDTSLVCSWNGVTCGSRHRRVAALRLSGLGLAGDLAPEIGNLTFLVSLNLTNNHFNGNLPQELSRLRRLRVMALGVNEFSGEIPAWIGFLNNLQTMLLHNNSFSSLSPHSLSNASRLEILNLRNNEIAGAIPQFVFNLPNVVHLDLSGNRFSGTLPSQLCSGIPRIVNFFLPYNQLEGEIPSNISACSQLTTFVVSANRLSGSIPSDMSSPSSRLEYIYLAQNNLVGDLPRNMGEWLSLRRFSISENGITGSLPATLGNLTNLRTLSLDTNNMTGIIPEEFGRLNSLEFFSLHSNSFTGGIPIDIFNNSFLRAFSIARNAFSGRLPSNLCSNLPNLEDLNLPDNELFGEIPQSISNCSNLRMIDAARNNFSGVIPSSLGELPFLEYLNLHSNRFISESAELTFITAMTSCQHLTVLNIAMNPFLASLPSTVGNFSSLERFLCEGCGLHGILPMEFGNLTTLYILGLGRNHFTGSIPNTFERLENFQGFDLSRNNITGIIPDVLCRWHRASIIYLNGNQITGRIPICIRNLTSLRMFWVSNNRLEDAIPHGLWELRDITELNLSANSLSGSLPSDIGRLQNVYLFDLSSNQLSGVIPSSIGDMNGLVQVNLSHNHLSGGIPTLLVMPSLLTFDVSFNMLSGSIPSEGPFQNFSSQFFQSNAGLCGESRFGVPPCRVLNGGSQSRRVILIVVCVTLAIFGVCFGLFLMYKLHHILKGSNVLQSGEEASGISTTRISYYDILHATDNLNDRCLLGTGAVGSVYKGILKDGNIVAIKVFNLQIEAALKSFDVECQVLRSLRHKNLCKVISSCSNNDFKALVMEYMPNESLERWLHTESHYLNILQRLSIMIDIACALEYLHQGYTVPVVHCDLKPSNILLDENMNGHLCDFGIAKLLGGVDTFVQTTTFATLGYIAPEYGSGGLVSTKCDVFSFGIVLLEVFTGKRPSADEFTGELTLRNLVKDFMSNEISKIVDLGLLNPDDAEFNRKSDCMSSIFELALKCSLEDPNERISMKEVVVALKNILIKLPGKRKRV